MVCCPFLESSEPSVGRLAMSSEMEYIIIIVAVCLVGIIVIILVSFTIAVSAWFTAMFNVLQWL